MTDGEEWAWARAEFGEAQLGDARRTSRLVKLAAAYAQRPRGTITQVMTDAAAREGAFRFVENEAVEVASIAAATHRAAALRCEPHARVIVPVDQATLTLTDRVGKAGFGRTGPSAEATRVRGFQVMSALAITPDGTTCGVLGQSWWSRTEKSPEYRRDRRPLTKRESSLWCSVLRQTRDVLALHGPQTRPWFQLDRGGDTASVLSLAVDEQLDLTARSAHNRTLASGGRLRSWMRKSPVLGRYSLALRGVGAPHATLSVRSSPVAVRIHDPKGRRVLKVAALWCVHVRERHAPRGREPIEWWLLTTVPVQDLADALLVVRNYTARWKIEEFHRAWKSGVCCIEDSQLRSAGAFQRWATIAASVAARAERLKTVSRATPHVDARGELSRDEIDAAILLTKRTSYRRGDDLTLEQAVLLIANLGGFTGKSSGGPPGTRVIQRGLDELRGAVFVLKALRRSD